MGRILSSAPVREGSTLLSITAQYALRAVVYLAGCSDGSPVRAAKLADSVLCLCPLSQGLIQCGPEVCFLAELKRFFLIE